MRNSRKTMENAGFEEILEPVYTPAEVGPGWRSRPGEQHPSHQALPHRADLADREDGAPIRLAWPIFGRFRAQTHGSAWKCMEMPEKMS